MPKSRTAVLDSVRNALAKPVDLDVLLAKAGQKDRANVTKHLAALNAEHGAIWKRLTQALATLAPLAITTVGQQAVQFFIADGKYRMQVFALEDQEDGQIVLFTPDILADAVKLKLIAPEPTDGQPDRFAVAAGKGVSLQIEQLNGSNTPNPSPHYKNMLGWNRKALRVVLPVAPSSGQLEAAEDLAAVAARAWVDKAKAEG